MDYTNIFKEYESLVKEADSAFEEIASDYHERINCEVGCADCCYSVFGLFLIEAIYIKKNFDKLTRKYRREALLRADKYEKDLMKIEKKLYNYNPEDKALAMARERLRCPLLSDENKCILYPYRPITCRVYGVPTVINGEMRFCWKSGFEEGESYPVYDMDVLYRQLWDLSKKYLQLSGYRDTEGASLLISVSKTIKTSPDELLNINMSQYG